MASNKSNSTNFTSCKEESEILLGPLLQWLIPILVVAGVLGNLMILIVLNSSKSMKTKPYLLLSAMAAADLAHTMVAFVIKLYVYEDLIDSDLFSRVYHHVLKTPFLVLANWMSMTSTWLAVAVTVERLIAIRYPLKARVIIRKRIIIMVIIIIAMISFVVSSYSIFWHRRIVRVSCQNPARKLYRLYGAQHLWYYGHVSRYLQSFLCSIVPVILLFIFNGSLVYNLHRNQALMRKFHDDRGRGPSQQVELMEWPSINNACNGEASGQQHQPTGATIRRECKVAVVVLVISLTSACCLLPSAALVVYDALRLAANINTTPRWYFTAVDISNLLILSGKVLDFFLYCLTSGYFRRRLLLVLRSRRRSSTSTPRQIVPKQATLQKRLNIFGRRKRHSSDPSNLNVVYLRQHDRRPSTSTLSTFMTSATFFFRRSTASSEGSQKSLKSSRKLLTVPD